MYNLFKNKLLVILTLFIVLISFIDTGVFASSFTYYLPEISSVVSESASVIISLSSDGTVYLRKAPSIIYIEEQNQFKIGNNISTSVYKLSEDNSSWELHLSEVTEATGSIYLTFSNEILYVQNVENYSLIPNMTTSEVVFQGAPQGTQLAQIVEQAETKKTLAEVLVIVPVILVIIVGLIGLRKALAFLQKLLRQS